ncbi:VCBS repeat-containing protein [Alkalimonas sp. MEB108]|uniref:VCBS repeat-containing protein n=1 Tax=Alkalimonas cellulosilytica TaxID=3058395 RepID=A0ABU7J9F3_9GAMM|nr:VCBS repeat-containing protein [Alkalimonas sp. MEB108]MEE2003164.1 VCBS repeat-containing protein [Alkalimonas sp. MEB108]
MREITKQKKSLNHALLASGISLLLVACGGSGNQDDVTGVAPPVFYSITVESTGAGNVGSETVQVAAGGRYSLSLYPDDDHLVHSVTGCNGTLSDTTYEITSVTANCRVEVTFGLVPLSLDMPQHIYSFYDDTMIPPHEYGGEYHEGGLVSYMGTASVQELWMDGYQDVIFSLAKGYAAGIDTRVKPYLFRNENGRLVYDNSVEFSPVTSARRWANYGERPNDHGTGLYFVGHDGGDGSFAEAMLIQSGSYPQDITASLPATPLSNLTGKPNSVHAHAMAGGDLNGNGRTDFVVIDWGGCDTEVDPWVCFESPYYLMQSDHALEWSMIESDLLRNIAFEQPLAATNVGEGWNLLLDVHLVDVNGNGLDDLIVGYGHGASRSYVYFNQGIDAQGGPLFSREHSAALPQSPYGYNGLHLFTWSADFNGNGHNDLLLLWSRFVPYYGGWSFQLLSNDGSGVFTDVSEQAFHYLSESHQLGEYLEWTDHFTVADLNGNGLPDIIGSDGGHSGSEASIRIWLNDGAGGLQEIPVQIPHTNRTFKPTAPWFDIAQDGVFGTAMMHQTATDDTFSELRVNFYQLSLNRRLYSLAAEQEAIEQALERN